MYGQRGDILAGSRRPGGASRDIRLTKNACVKLRWLGFADSSKGLKPTSTRGKMFEFRLENHKRLAIHHKTELAARAEDRRRP